MRASEYTGFTTAGMFQAYAVLLCATRDLKLASLAILAISVILTWVLATLVALGWSMNVVLYSVGGQLGYHLLDLHGNR